MVFNLWKSRNLYLTDFKTKREHYRSINSITLIVLEKNTYPYVRITNHPTPLPSPHPFEKLIALEFNVL